MPRLSASLRPLYPYVKPAYVGVTRLVSPVMVQISRLHGGQLPTGAVVSMEEAAATSGGRCVVVRPPELIQRPPFLGHPGALPPLEPATDTDIGRIAAMELPGGRVLGRHHAVITGQGDLVYELSRYFGTTRPSEHPLFLSPFPGNPVEVAGRLGVLASRGDSNYYHFLIDVLPRIGLLEQCPSIAPPDQWYVPAKSAFQLQLLDLMGITPDQRIDSEDNPHVRAECLVVPGLPSVAGEMNPPWVVDFLRRRLMANVPDRAGRMPLYITRSAGANNRAVVNEQDLVHMLERRGFRIVDPSRLSVMEQIEAFASASVIVSPHGAALANLVFASPHSTVIELFPPGCVLPDYWRLATSVPGVTYRYFSGWPEATRRNRPMAIVSDMTVDVAALSAMLTELGH